MYDEYVREVMNEESSRVGGAQINTDCFSKHLRTDFGGLGGESDSKDAAETQNLELMFISRRWHELIDNRALPSIIRLAP